MAKQVAIKYHFIYDTVKSAVNVNVFACVSVHRLVGTTCVCLWCVVISLSGESPSIKCFVDYYCWSNIRAHYTHCSSLTHDTRHHNELVITDHRHIQAENIHLTVFVLGFSFYFLAIRLECRYADIECDHYNRRSKHSLKRITTTVTTIVIPSITSSPYIND